MCPDEIMKKTIYKLPVGDWFIFDRLAKNMAQVHFSKFVKRYYASFTCSCDGEGCDVCLGDPV